MGERADRSGGLATKAKCQTDDVGIARTIAQRILAQIEDVGAKRRRKLATNTGDVARLEQIVICEIVENFARHKGRHRRFADLRRIIDLCAVAIDGSVLHCRCYGAPEGCG